MHRLLAGAVLVGIALALALLFGGAGFLNYDTTFALVWGREIAGGVLPDFEAPLAPTPHPLATQIGISLSPLSGAGPSGGAARGALAEQVVVVAAYLLLGALGWVVFRLGQHWFGWPAGVLAAAIVLTREPVLSFGLRAYVDIGYLVLVLGALLVEARRSRAGAPVLVLLASAGLLRPEAWLFSGVYLGWLWWSGHRSLGGLAALAAAAPLIWALSDLIITGNPLHSFTGTRDTAADLGRVTGLDDVPLTMPRRLGEILREPVLVGAAGGGLIALAWRRSRALLPAIVGVVAVGAFCVLAGAGLPILTRYLLLPAVVLAIFCGAGALGWLQLARGDRRRRPWAAFGAVVGVLLIVFAPAQVRRLDRLQAALATQGRILTDLRGLTVSQRGRGTAELRAGCGPLTVPNQRAVPHLALALALSPRDIRNAQERPPLSGVYLVPSSPRVARQFVLNRIDERRAVVPVPPGFRQSGSSGAWRVYRKAESPLGLRPPNC